MMKIVRDLSRNPGTPPSHAIITIEIREEKVS